MAQKPKAAAKPHGNAFKWTAEIEAEILSRIMRGDSVATICGDNRDDFLPGEGTFYKHLAEDDDFAKRYARAREAQAASLTRPRWQVRIRPRARSSGAPGVR